MTLSSLLISLIKNILPAEYFIAGAQKLPFEILDEIVDYLKGEKRSLLTLSLVCRYTHQRSRAILFETLVFSNGIEDCLKFDRFLDLLEGPPTTIAPYVKSIRVTNIFLLSSGWKRRQAAHQLAPKLSRLTNFQLASQQWPAMPPTFHDFLLALPAVEVSIENTVFYTTEQFVELFKSSLIAQGSQDLTLYNLELDDGPNALLDHAHIFEQNYHFRAIDSTSLVNFYNVWDPARSKAKITVDSFHLHLSGLGVRQMYLPFLRNFLLETGTNLKSLVIDLCDPHFGRSLVLSAYKELDFTSCTVLRAVHVGIIRMDEQQAAHMNVTWKLLESIPPFAIETIGLIFDNRDALDDLAMSLRSFPWTETIQRIQGIFPSSKRIKIKIGAYDLEKDVLAAQVDFLARGLRPGFTKLSAQVSFAATTWTPFHVSLERLYWRDFSA